MGSDITLHVEEQKESTDSTTMLDMAKQLLKLEDKIDEVENIPAKTIAKDIASIKENDQAFQNADSCEWDGSTTQTASSDSSLSLTSEESDNEVLESDFEKYLPLDSDPLVGMRDTALNKQTKIGSLVDSLRQRLSQRVPDLPEPL